METNVTSSNLQAPQLKKNPTPKPRKVSCPRCRLKKRTCIRPQIGAPCQTCIDEGQHESCEGSVPTDAKLGKQQGSQKTYVHVSVQTQEASPSGVRIVEGRCIIIPPQSTPYRLDEGPPFSMNPHQYPAPPPSGQVYGPSIISGAYHFAYGQAVGNNYMTADPPYQAPLPQQAPHMHPYPYQEVDNADPAYRHEFIPSGSPHDVSAAGSSLDPSYPSRAYQP